MPPCPTCPVADAIAAYDLAFTAVYAVAPRFFDIFVVVFVLACAWVILQSARIYRVTYDVRLRRLFWVGFGIYAAAFLVMWIPDNLFCERVGWLHLHAWFHVCSSIAPYWWIMWATHSFYTRRYAERTGLLRMADGSECIAPLALMESLVVRVLPESRATFTRSVTREMHSLAPKLAAWAEAQGVSHLQRRPSLVQEMQDDGTLGQRGSPMSQEDRPPLRVASDPSATILPQDGEQEVGTGGGAAGGRMRRTGAGHASSPLSYDQASSRGGGGGGGGPLAGLSVPTAIIVNDSPLPVPELHWYGPRSLLVLPYVHLEWRQAPPAQGEGVGGGAVDAHGKSKAT